MVGNSLSTTPIPGIVSYYVFLPMEAIADHLDVCISAWRDVRFFEFFYVAKKGETTRDRVGLMNVPIEVDLGTIIDGSTNEHGNGLVLMQLQGTFKPETPNGPVASPGDGRKVWEAVVDESTREGVLLL